MRRSIRTAALLFALAATPALAHDPAPGPNGGMQVDAGRYHAELVARGTPEVVVFLSDGDKKPIPSTGFRANAILVIEGKTHRFPMQAADGSRLVGQAPVAVPAGAKGAVQLTGPDGATAQARF